MTERDIFFSALDIEDLSARREYLQEACGNDAELLERVQALLESHENAGEFLNTPAVQQIAEEPAEDKDRTIAMAADSTSDKPDPAMTVPMDNAENSNSRREGMNEELSLGFLQPATRMRRGPA